MNLSEEPEAEMTAVLLLWKPVSFL